MAFEFTPQQRETFLQGIQTYINKGSTYSDFPKIKDLPNFKLAMYEDGKAVVVKFTKEVRPLYIVGKAFKIGDRNVGPHFPPF